MKGHLITVLIILAIFAVAFIFGTAMIESKSQAFHAVSGMTKPNVSGQIFLTIVMTGFACFASYMTILVRKD